MGTARVFTSLYYLKIFFDSEYAAYLPCITIKSGCKIAEYGV